MDTLVAALRAILASLGSEVFLGAFLGFASALAVQYLWSRLQDAKRARTLMGLLVEEANGNLTRLHEGGNAHETRVTATLYDTSIWDGAVASDKIGAIADQKVIGELSRMYFRIAVARQWDMLLAQSFLTPAADERRFRDLISCVAEARSQATLAIEGFLNSTEKKERSHA